ncbi:MAG: hypothetical protein B7Z73_15045, partial [Planctomycetia bacterium 21-64-5]
MLPALGQAPMPGGQPGMPAAPQPAPAAAPAPQASAGSFNDVVHKLVPYWADRFTGVDINVGVLIYVVVQALLYLVVVLWWVSGADWVNRDRYFRKQNRNWNLAVCLPFGLCFLASGFLCHPVVSLLSSSVTFWIGYVLQF